MLDNLERLQELELHTLRQILGIVEKHNLTYYILGGTLLGAVRHKGFIPWDDDMDIGLPRPDYERFLKYAEEELSPPYQLHTAQNGRGEYSYYYARVENTDYHVRRKLSLKDVVIPVFVDVFPLDGVPNDPSAFQRWLRTCRLRFKVFSLSQYMYFGKSDDIAAHRSPVISILRRAFIRLRLDRLISTRWAWRRLDAALKRYDFDTCDRLVNFCGAWRMKEMFDKKVYGRGRLYPFGDLMLNGPEDYDYVLTQMYGDYMTPPEQKDREHHYLELVVRSDGAAR